MLVDNVTASNLPLGSHFGHREGGALHCSVFFALRYAVIIVSINDIIYYIEMLEAIMI